MLEIVFCEQSYPFGLLAMYVSGRTECLMFQSMFILGNPGATSRVDAMFSGESLLQELESPWKLTLTEPVPEMVKFRPADWPEKYFFWLISEEF